jgi:hypothetical protein
MIVHSTYERAKASVAVNLDIVDPSALMGNHRCTFQ